MSAVVPSFRLPALDGVRALAVLAVLAAHTGLPGFHGGFIGVDVFFVLSGFLITSLLLDERERTGQINLGAFWSSRARRLLPGALTMVATVVALRPLLPPEAVGGLRGDALTSALWSSNWRWALHGTDYFAQGGTASPLQHTWSLAVEEQFYLVWPGLLIVLWRGAAAATSLRRRLVVLAAAGAAASALLTLVLSDTASAGRVYFGSDTRAQELLIGAVLAAALAPTWRRRSERRRARRSTQWLARRPIPAVLSTCGLFALVATAHYAGGATGEFRHGLMAAVATAAAALLAGVLLDSRTPLARWLSTRPMVAMGRLSYGIYLWHWPTFLILDGARTHLTGYPLAALRVAVSVVAAAASLLLIELPARQLRLAPRRLLPASGLGIVSVLVFAGCSTPSGQAATSAASTAGVDLPPSITSTSQPAPKRATVTPSGAGRRVNVDVFGDSIAWTLVTYLPATPGYRFTDRTVLGCGIVQGGPYRYYGAQHSAKKSCDAWPTRWSQQIRADRPDEVLLLVGRWETMDRLYHGRWTHVGDAAFDHNLAALLGQAIDRLAGTGARVIVANEPYNRRGEQPNGDLYPEDQPQRVDRWNHIVTSVVSAHPAATLLDLHSKLCPEGRFTWQVDGVQVRSDGVHLTPQGVKWLTPWLLGQLRRAR